MEPQELIDRAVCIMENGATGNLEEAEALAETPVAPELTAMHIEGAFLEEEIDELYATVP